MFLQKGSASCSRNVSQRLRYFLDTLSVEKCEVNNTPPQFIGIRLHGANFRQAVQCSSMQHKLVLSQSLVGKGIYSSSCRLPYLFSSEFWEHDAFAHMTCYYIQWNMVNTLNWTEQSPEWSRLWQSENSNIVTSKKLAVTHKMIIHFQC